MAEPDSVSAGRIELEVVADLEGFERKLQREVDRRVRDAKARIRAELDARRLATDTKTAVQAAERAATIRVQVDRESLRRDLASALTGISSTNASVKVTPEIDAGRLRQEVDAAARSSRARVTVGADTTPARDELGRFVRQGEQQPVRKRVEIDQSSLRQAGSILAGLGKAGVAAGGLILLAGAAGAAGGGLLALAAAGSQAIGVLGILPGIAGMAVQGLAGLMVGMSGVGTALQALSQADKASGASAASAAAAREAAAERIRNAERAIRDATHARMLANERVGDAKDASVEAAKAVQAAEQRVRDAVARVAEARQRVADAAAEAGERQEQAARRVEMAERRLADAHKNTRRAVEDLNEARRQAKERLEDLELAVRGGALDEESSALAVERAKQRLEKVVADPFASDLDRREADLAYRQALQRLAEVKERNGDLREEQQEAADRGVEGSKEVEDAKERVADSIQAEKDAEVELAQARKDAAKSAVEGAKAIEAASRGVAEALKTVADAQEDVKQAQKAQVRAERDVREALWDQMLAVERLRDAQRDLAKAKREAKTAGQTSGGVDPAAQALADLSPAMRDLVLYLHREVRPALRDIRMEVQEALAPGLKAGVQAAMPLLKTVKRGLASTGLVVGDLAEDFGKLVGGKAFSGYVSRIMGRNNTAISLFGKAGISAFKGVTRIIDVSMPYVVKFADVVAKLADRFDKWSKGARKDGTLDDFFRDSWEMASKLWRIVSNLVSGLGKILKLAMPSGGTLLEDLAQAAEDFNRWLDKPEVQEGFRRFFAELVPLLREAGGLVKDVVVFLGRLIETIVVDGDLTGFLGWLRDIVGWLGRLVDNPAIAEIATWAVIIGGVTLAIGLLVKKISALTKGLGLLARAGKGVASLTGLSKLFGGGDDKPNSGSKPGSGSCACSCCDGDDGGRGRKTTNDGRGRHRKTTDGTGRGTPDVEPRKRTTPDSGKRRKGKSGGLSGLIGDLGLELLGDIDWDKEGKNLAGKLGGKVKGGVIGTVAGLLVDPIVDAFKGDANKGGASAAAEAVKQGLAGAGLGAMIGSIIPGVGTAIGGAVGGAIGAAKGGLQGFLGDRVFSNLFGSAFSADGVALVLSEVGKLFGGAGPSLQQKWAAIWAGLDKGTQAGADGLSQRMGTFLDLTNGKFVGLAKGAPSHIQKMWADIKRDLDAGISPSQEKIDAFIRAGGGGFVKLGKDAPKELQEGWRQALLGIDTFTSTGSNRLGTFIRGAGGAFAELKTSAPQHVRDAWAAIQTDLDAGIPPSQAKIDAFVAAGGGSFVKLKKDAPQALRDALGEINRDLSTGLQTASLKLGQFVQEGGAKFLKMRTDAPGPLRAMWADIQRDIDAGRQPSQAKIDAFVKAGGGSFLKLSKDAPADVRKGWSDISAGVDPGLAPAKKKVAETTKAMQDSFGTAKSGIEKIWQALPDAMKAPIRWIVANAYGTIMRLWNGIAGAVKLPPLPSVSVNFAKGGVVPGGGYGIQPGYLPGKDTMLAAVSPGEAWLRPELARALGGGFIDGANRAARVGGVSGASSFLAGSGLMGFAKGGQVPGGKSGGAKPPKKEQTPLERLLSGVSANLRNLFSKGLGAGARAALSPIRNAITSAIGTETALQRLMGGIPREMIDAVIAKFELKDRELNRDSGGPLHPGRSLVNNATGKTEWVLTPAAVAALGGPKVVQSLNDHAAGLYRSSRSAARAVPAAGLRSGGERGPVTVIVQPQPGQDEYAIAGSVARRIGSQTSQV
ncbi:hypothetical protein [Nonomuraea dietziae]|uniref:hypothetical protein n=1 Tax=Nonomuraea dietziae TaxID=65515 RepID=UPI0033E96221